MSIEKAKEFVEDYSIDDISIFNRQNEHFFLYDLLEEYSKTFTPQPTNSLDELERLQIASDAWNACMDRSDWENRKAWYDYKKIPTPLSKIDYIDSLKTITP